MSLFKRNRKIARNSFNCSVKWREMKGSDEVRFCDVCQHKVYDLRGLTEKEVIRFIELEEGEVCAMAHYNRMGRVVNGACKSERGPIQVKVGKVRVLSKEEREDAETSEKIEEAQQRLSKLKALRKLMRDRQNHK